MSKSAAKEFELSLASDVGNHFRDDSIFELKKLSLLWRTQAGFNVVSFANNNKWSPFVSVAFYYGCRFQAAYDIEKSLTKHPTGMHICQFSVNRPLIKDLAYDGPHGWEVDIRSAPSNLAGEIATAIRCIAFPFFDRFHDMREARNATEANHNWCFGANPLGWHSMLYMDAALGELDHFEQWVKVLPEFYRQQAEAELARVRLVSSVQTRNRDA